MLHVQLHTSTESVKLMSSEVEFSRLFGIVCVYRDSHQEIRPFKVIQMTVIAPPKFHSVTQHSPVFLSGDCRTAYIAGSSVRVGWRNSGTCPNQTWRLEKSLQHTSTHPVWRNTPAASAFLCHLPRHHSHWGMPYTLMQTPFVSSLAIVSRACSNLLGGEWAEWCEAISSWCFIGWGWVVHSDKNTNGVCECYKDNCMTHFANWRSIEVLSLPSANLCASPSDSCNCTVTYWQCS